MKNHLSFIITSSTAFTMDSAQPLSLCRVFHLAKGISHAAFPVHGLLSRTSRIFLPQQPSVLRAIFPAHCHFTLPPLGYLGDWSLSTDLLISNSIALSIVRLVTLSFLKSCLRKAKMSKMALPVDVQFSFNQLVYLWNIEASNKVIDRVKSDILVKRVCYIMTSTCDYVDMHRIRS